MASVNLEIFAQCIADICSHSFCIPDRRILWTIIANPVAGGFTIRSRWEKHYRQLCECQEKARLNRLNKNASPAIISDLQMEKNGLVVTGKAGQAFTITKKLIDTATSSLEDAFYIILSAGGDGTSREVLSALLDGPRSFLENCAVIRLPMGTGNDGADSPEIAGALEVLIRQSKKIYGRSLKLCTATPQKGPFEAFNVLSVGLDAFVAHYTNKMKGKTPGDSYKLWVDIASLFYDMIYKVGPMKVEAFDDNGKVVYLGTLDVLLMAVGVSGMRTYGSHKWILPDERNVCIIKQMPVWRKIKLKEQFNTGAQAKEKEALLFNAQKINFSARYPLLAQMDGETVLLNKEDFPASIELTEAVIPHFVLVEGGANGGQ